MMKIIRLAMVILAVGCGALALSPWAVAAKSDTQKTHATTKKPASAAKGKSAVETGKVERLLDGTGYKFVKRKPNVWSMAFAGKTLGKSVVVLTETPKLLVIFTIVGTSAATDKTPQLMQISAPRQQHVRLRQDRLRPGRRFVRAPRRAGARHGFAATQDRPGSVDERFRRARRPSREIHQALRDWPAPPPPAPARLTNRRLRSPGGAATWLRKGAAFPYSSYPFRGLE